jgi:hypothetical protein
MNLAIFFSTPTLPVQNPSFVDCEQACYAVSLLVLVPICYQKAIFEI